MFEKNLALLRESVASHAAIIGEEKMFQMEREAVRPYNLNLWNRIMEPFEKISLWAPGETPDYDDRDPLQPEPYLVFVPAPEGGKKSTVLIAHGGGFSTRTGYEGTNVALWFHEAGYNTAILCYRLQPYSRLDAMADMHRAIRVLRARRTELGISEQIAVMGFSAGGMLSANCATHFDAGNPDAADPAERESCRPDAAVICYGAFTYVSAIQGWLLRGINPMFGRDYREAVYLAPEKNVTPDCPPFYIWQPMSDDGRHGMTLARSLQDVGVPYELHIFQSGFHGNCLSDGENDGHRADPHSAHWASLCAEWLEYNGIR